MFGRVISHRFFRFALLGGALLVLSVIALSAFFHPTTKMFASGADGEKCHLALSLKVPSRSLIVSPPGCQNFNMRVNAQPSPTRLKVCPQTTASPIMIQLIGNPYQEEHCLTWVAKTGEWHNFYRYTTITDPKYTGFLVILQSVQDRPEYSIDAEIQQ